MRRVHCIVEGQTEVAVFSQLLRPYIYQETGAWIDFTPLKYSGGGMVPYSKLLIEIRNHLMDREKIVTTFFDYYGILAKHNFPGYSEAKVQQSNPKVGVDILEVAMEKDISSKGYSTGNFIPYIQMHEFESLLFSNNDGFEFQYDEIEIINSFERIRNRYQTPEDINDSPLTAPSKRIESVLAEHRMKYRKVIDGETIAVMVGIENMIKECPRFGQWVETIIAKVK